MGDVIHLGSFAKRKNSTKQPGSLSDSRTIKLKQSTSITNPVFILSGDLFNYNYCEWDDRYYFITDIISVHDDLTEVHCELDPLATYKSEILNTTAYILYDSTPNTELVDNRLPMKTTKNVLTSSVACPFVPDEGCYILSLTGSNGTTGVYKVSESQLGDLIDDVQDVTDNLFDSSQNPMPNAPTFGTDIAENIKLFAEYVGALIKWSVKNATIPFSQFFGSQSMPENIRECKYIPFNVGVTGGSQTIYLGTFKTKSSFGKLATETIHRTATVSIPWQSSDFRRRSPYTEIYLYLPYIGMTKISSENLVGQSSISVAYTLAMRNGALICTVSSGGQIIGQYSGNVGVSVPVGVSNISLPKVGGAIVTGAVAAASFGSGGSIAPLGMAALNFHESITPNFSTIGGLDGIASIGANQNIVCYTVYHDTIVPPNQNLDVIGSPSMCSKLIGSLSGFCQCADAHVEAAAEGQELEIIDSYLNSGFFIE